MGEGGTRVWRQTERWAVGWGRHTKTHAGSLHDCEGIVSGAAVACRRAFCVFVQQIPGAFLAFPSCLLFSTAA